jgi:hypothetical protein
VESLSPTTLIAGAVLLAVIIALTFFKGEHPVESFVPM